MNTLEKKYMYTKIFFKSIFKRIKYLIKWNGFPCVYIFEDDNNSQIDLQSQCYHTKFPSAFIEINNSILNSYGNSQDPV
jgi:hypothetical protein